MTILKQILITLLLLTCIINAQQGDVNDPELKDSVYRYQGINPHLNLNDNSFDFIIPYDFSLSNSNQLAEGDLATLWLRTEFALSHFSNPTFGADINEDHMMMPLYKQYLENSKIDPIRYVLGIAQMATVGYMAYTHIKKYGFFK